VTADSGLVPRPPDSAPSLEWVLQELASLAAHGLRPILFGGWAKQLLGRWPGGPHQDLDVLVRAQRIEELDAYLAARRAQPFSPKRHPHKRGYLLAGTLVELFLVSQQGDELVTDFYGGYRRVWPAPISSELVVSGQPIELATPATILAYERDHRHVQDALFASQPGLREQLLGSYGLDYVPCRHPFPAS
jgi:hypothetical protein